MGRESEFSLVYRSIPAESMCHREQCVYYWRTRTCMPADKFQTKWVYKQEGHRLRFMVDRNWNLKHPGKISMVIFQELYTHQASTTIVINFSEDQVFIVDILTLTFF